MEGRLFFPKGCFEVGLPLPFTLLFKDPVSYLHLTSNQLFMNTIRPIMSMVVLDHMKGLRIMVEDVLYTSL